MLRLAVFLMILSVVASVQPPVVAEQFQVDIKEVDDTTGETTLHQTLAFDLTNRRSRMTAQGPLVEGYLEQVMRCDILPMGYLVVIGGAAPTPVSGLECTNYTLNSDPASCQFSAFWSIPANASYIGTKTVNGEDCDAWMYWQEGEQYNVFYQKGNAVPVRISKVSTSHAGYHLWHLDFTNFKAGAPPLSAFVPTPGVKCTHPSGKAPRQVGSSNVYASLRQVTLA